MSMDIFFVGIDEAGTISLVPKQLYFDHSGVFRYFGSVILNNVHVNTFPFNFQ